jgi:hypothetical protein
VDGLRVMQTVSCLPATGRHHLTVRHQIAAAGRRRTLCNACSNTDGQSWGGDVSQNGQGEEGADAVGADSVLLGPVLDREAGHP